MPIWLAIVLSAFAGGTIIKSFQDPEHGFTLIALAGIAGGIWVYRALRNGLDPSARN